MLPFKVLRCQEKQPPHEQMIRKPFLPSAHSVFFFGEFLHGSFPPVSGEGAADALALVR